MNVETVSHGGSILAIIIYRDFTMPGLHFFTPDEFSQQLAYMNHRAGKQILPHTHNPVERQVRITQEVLIVKTGRVRVDFYGNDQAYIESRVLASGDVILLSDGGHGFEILEDAEIIEVKQGPYAGYADKVKFEPVESGSIMIRQAPEV